MVEKRWGFIEEQVQTPMWERGKNLIAQTPMWEGGKSP